MTKHVIFLGATYTRHNPLRTPKAHAFSLPVDYLNAAHTFASSDLSVGKATQDAEQRLRQAT